MDAPDLTLLLTPLVDEASGDWEEKALCAETDPEAFFPEKGQSSRAAKQICMACEVRTECLEAALANQEPFGIWGGLTERERRALRRSGVDARTYLGDVESASRPIPAAS